MEHFFANLCSNFQVTEKTNEPFFEKGCFEHTYGQSKELRRTRAKLMLNNYYYSTIRKFMTLFFYEKAANFGTYQPIKGLVQIYLM